MRSVQMTNKFSPLKKRYRILLGLLFGLSLFGLVNACSVKRMVIPEYALGRDTRLREIPLMGKEQNLAAFNDELLNAIADEEHFHIRVAVTSDPIKDLEEKKFQGVITTLKPSYLNENRLVFSEPYFLFGPVLIIPSDTAIEGWNEKRRKIVGIEKYSPMLLSLEEDPTVQLKIYDDILKALSDLSTGKIEGALFPAIPAYIYTHTFYKHELKIATLPLTDDGIRLAALKNNEGKELVKTFDEGLEKLKNKGAYRQMLERWGLVVSEEIPSSSIGE